MIDVLKTIEPLMSFDSEDDFYYLQILQRKKENPQLGSNSRVIRNYYIHNIQYLHDRYDEIKTLCTAFNARAMLRLNKRSFRKTAMKTMVNVANSCMNCEFRFVSKSWDRACGQGHNDKDKKWILDYDGFDDGHVPMGVMSLFLDVAKYHHKGIDGVITNLPTKNGVHLICTPFDTTEFRKEFPEVDIHKDNPINLFIP